MKTPALTPLARSLMLALPMASLGLPALAQDTTQTITITAKSGAYNAEKDTASSVAPTQASLLATQPQSIITREFIEQSVAPTAEYSRVVNIAPSLSGNSANGPGLSETKTTMRGFSDDQYNITFDGIPWGDTNNPAHHSTSFFPAAVMGSAIVERGPGNASNIGYATFGGSINLFSKKARAERNTEVFGAYGTWNTSLLGFSHETGRMADLGGSTFQVNVQDLRSDGYLSLSKIVSDNVTAKFERPVGADSVLTLFTSINHINYTQPDNSNGPTLNQIALYGRNFLLNNDPTSFNYTGFNHTTKDTDFEYVRLRTTWAPKFTTEAQAYTYAYNNQTISSTDPRGLTAPGTKAVGAAVGNKNIPGIDKQNKYRVYGAIVKGEKQFDVGLLRAGAWLEKSDTDRHQYDRDLTLGVIPNPVEKTAPFDVLFHQLSKIQSAQPYAEFEWEPLAGLTVTPGIKGVDIKRSIDADVNQTTRLPLNTSVKYHTTLPFLTVNHQIQPGLAVYGQYAKGYQIPDLNTFYITDPSKNSPEPQMSTNYQLGLVGQNKSLTWDVDVYKIDFKNKYVSNGLTGAAAAYINVGGATYKGVEGQVTVLLPAGFALYANGSVNKATALDTGKQISGAPDMTAAFGVIYNSGPWSASVIGKRTGASYMKNYAGSQAYYDFYRIPAYDNVDLSLSYQLGAIIPGTRSTKIQLNVFNAANSSKVTSIAAGSSSVINSAGDQYLFQVPRSFQLSAKVGF